MNIYIRIFAAGSLLYAGHSIAIAQAVAPTAPVAVLAPAAPAPTPTLVIAQPERPVLRQGTAVRFVTDQALSSQKSKEGDRFELRSVEPVNVGTMLVIPAGARAVGEVTRAEKKGAFGKSGKLDTRILYVVVGDQRISMAGKANQQGSSGTVGVVVAAALFWPAMPFITGKSAELPVGTAMTGYVENDLPLVMATAAPAPQVAPFVVQAAAPMVVPVAVTAAASPAPAPAAPSPIAKRAAKTPSGFCLETPSGYVGSGTVDLPTPNAQTPACSSVK